MVTNEPTGTQTADREIVTTRTFEAPRDLVFKMWTDRRHIEQWWGPNGFTTTIQEMDVRPGGMWRFVMHGPDGTDYQNRITYEEVVEPERLVYAHGDDNEPEQFRGIVTFEDEEGKTRLTLRTIFASAEERDRVVREVGAIDGAKQTLGRLAEYLASQRTP
jgi:uncharacterized protein YndB with AHSA1/START domain